MFLCHQLAHGKHRIPLSISRSGFKKIPLPSCLLLIPRIPSANQQIRLKSKARKNSSKIPAPPKPKTSADKPIRPNPPRQPIVEVYEKAAPEVSFIADLLDWKYSRRLLTILVNSAALVIFALWVREADRARQAKPEDESIETDKGKFVESGTGEKRFITPGQEWLLDNFTVTPINLEQGRWWTLGTSIFSHQIASHAFINMLMSHLLFTGMSPVFGTIPVATTFLVGGVGANAVMSTWMKSRGGEFYEQKYPGQFFGGLGMSAANYSMVGFAAAIYPKWGVKLYGVIPLKMNYLVFGVWLYELYQFWKQTGFEKIQASVCKIY